MFEARGASSLMAPHIHRPLPTAAAPTTSFVAMLVPHQNNMQGRSMYMVLARTLLGTSSVRWRAIMEHSVHQGPLRVTSTWWVKAA